jgi:hypothetical protein
VPTFVSPGEQAGGSLLDRSRSGTFSDYFFVVRAGGQMYVADVELLVDGK